MSDPQIGGAFTAKKVVNVHYSRGIDHDLSDFHCL